MSETDLEVLGVINAALVEHGAPEYLSLDVAITMTRDEISLAVRKARGILIGLLDSETGRNGTG